MPQLTIIAHIHAHTDQTDFVKTELLKIVAPTLAEEGCLNYDLHQDNEDPAHFFFYENWASRDLWQKHMESDHLAAFKEKTDGSIDKVVLHEMSPVK